MTASGPTVTPASQPAPPPATLVVGDLTLAAWRPADDRRALAAVVESLPELAPWMPWATEAYDIAASRDYLRHTGVEWASGAGYTYALVETADPEGPVLGAVGLHRRIGPGAFEIGYWVRSSHTGRGYATRAAAALTRAAFALPGIDRVEIHHDVANPASGRVPERLGFTRFAMVAVPAQAPSETGQQHHWRLHAADYAGSRVEAVPAERAAS